MVLARMVVVCILQRLPFCSRTLINAGVKEVYAMSKYSHDDAIALLTEGGIKVRVISPVELTDLVRFI